MNQYLLDRFYEGKCSPEEVKEVLAWFKSRKLTPGQEEKLAEFWAQAKAGPLERDNQRTDKIWRNLQPALFPGQEEQTATIVRFPGQVWKTWAKVAAAIVLPLGFLWLMASSYFQKDAAVTGQLVMAKAEPGQHKTIQLEDGSTIVLRPNSTVSYRQPFAKNRRDIMLEGEAFFQVAKDKSRPFVVKSGAIYTQALGTSFNIRHLPKDSAVSVSLATGMVKISREEKDGPAAVANLVPGQQLRFNSTSQRYKVARFDTREVLGWKDGILSFKKADLAEVISSLEAWYGVQIKVEGTQPKGTAWSYTGEYTRQSLPQVLEGIGFVKQFSYRINQKNVALTFKNPKPM